MTLILKITMKTTDETLVRNLSRQLQLIELMEYIDKIELFEEAPTKKDRSGAE